MNKKFFAALASATMALSATGSLAVFADDFDVDVEINQAWQGTTSVNPDGSVVLNSTNFPNKTFRDALEQVFDKDKAITKDQLADVTAINVTNNTVTVTVAGTQYTSTVKDKVDSLAGIDVFGDLTDFSADNVYLSDINLAKNEKLNSVVVNNATNLDSIELPASNALKTLVVKGTSTDNRCPLPILDLSANKGLNIVDVEYTDVAVLDLSGNTQLTDVNVGFNKLNTLNLEGSISLKNLDCYNNHLYSLELPAYSNLTALNASQNKLVSLDLTKQPKLQTLYVNNNCLKTLDLSQNKALSFIWAQYNNLGYLNLEKTSVNNLQSYQPAEGSYPNGSFNKFDTAMSAISPQHAFVDADYDSVDLKDVFEDINTDRINGPENGLTSKKGVLTFDEESDTGYYGYDTKDTKTGSNMTVFVLKADLMNRLYNPNSGEHFYTKDVNEKDVLVGLGWKDEGIGWVAPAKEIGTGSKSPVYRLYNPNAGDHHYTKDSRERDALVSAGWKAEGIGWYTPNTDINYYVSGATGSQPSTVNVTTLDLYREYNPNAKAAGSHNYTLNEAENDFLCSIGWIPEGIAWSSLK